MKGTKMIPKTLKIGGLNFEIVVEPHRRRDHGVDSSASENCKYQKIWLDSESQKADGMMDDLLHEVFEAINCLYDLPLNHQTITTLAEALHQVLRDNRLVFFEESDGKERSL